MKSHIKTFSIVLFALVAMSVSCTESKTTSEEEIRIKTMDSTSKAVKENTEKLDEQTKKVEASLEKLETEFETSN